MQLHAIIVEDKATIREGLRDTLKEGNQFLARTANDLKKALTLLKQNRYDCGVIDLELQGEMTGLKVIEQLRHANPHAYIEVITGFEMQGNNALSCGADLVVEKPFKPHGYAERVARGVVRKRVERILDTFDLRTYSIDIPKNVINRQWASFALAIDTTFINLQSLKSNVETSNFHQIAYQMLVDVLCMYDAACASPTMDVSTVGDELQTDVDFRAFEELLQNIQFVEQHQGEFVAIVEGKVVGFGLDFQRLVQDVEKRFPDTDAYIDQINVPVNE